MPYPISLQEATFTFIAKHKADGKNVDNAPKALGVSPEYMIRLLDGKIKKVPGHVARRLGIRVEYTYYIDENRPVAVVRDKTKPFR